MSKKNKRSNNSTYVGRLNFKEVKNDIDLEIDISENLYKKFCDDYLEKDLNKIKSNELKKIYEDGIELLNSYYITEVENTINNFIFQIQFITIKINSVIENRQNQELMKRNRELNNNLNQMIKRAEKLEKNVEEEKEQMKHVKNDIKGIITTILAIVLAFSIIPTAITAIQKIDTNYILPFMASIILFGMFMVIFIYSIYQDKLKKSTWAIFIISIIIGVLLWISSIYGNTKLNKNEIDVEENREDKVKIEKN
ncbi:MAG: hypothetical protein HFJ40_00240 [Clostridia bacterium]|nr:hypothetical protein [Clostridia bacterium]